MYEWVWVCVYEWGYVGVGGRCGVNVLEDVERIVNVCLLIVVLCPRKV